MTGTILLVDGDPGVLRTLGAALEEAGFEVARELDGGAALAAVDRFDPDVAVVGLAGAEGQELLAQLRDRQVPVVMVLDGSSQGGGEGGDHGVELLRRGAAHVLSRPPDAGVLAEVCAHEAAAARVRRAAAWIAMQEPPAVRLATLGASPAMKAVAHQIQALAQSERATLLIRGEPGVGKRWTARLIHDLSPRAAEPFLEVACHSGESGELETLLFGCERGAVAGAQRRQRGVLELAGGGTAVLAQVHALPPELQPVLLRTLETRSFRRVGGFRDLPCGARVIATTSRDLSTATETGTGLREDLAYRLSTTVLVLPPLRERSEHDRLTLLTALHARLARVMTGPPPLIDAAAMERLLAHPWPGNVREMAHVLERAALLARDAGVILVEHLPGELRARPGLGDRRHQPRSLEEAERLQIESALRFHGGNRTRAARELRISRATLINKIKRYGLGD
jgi:DNA-binding NtrC family response regulator